MWTCVRNFGNRSRVVCTGMRVQWLRGAGVVLGRPGGTSPLYSDPPQSGNNCTLMPGKVHTSRHAAFHPVPLSISISRSHQYSSEWQVELQSQGWPLSLTVACQASPVRPWLQRGHATPSETGLPRGQLESKTQPGERASGGPGMWRGGLWPLLHRIKDPGGSEPPGKPRERLKK